MQHCRSHLTLNGCSAPLPPATPSPLLIELSPLILPRTFTQLNFGVMKQGWGMCGTFQSCKLTYLHVLPAGMVYILVRIEFSPIYRLTLHACTNVPLSSARLLTSFQQPHILIQLYLDGPGCFEYIKLYLSITVSLNSMCFYKPCTQ